MNKIEFSIVDCRLIKVRGIFIINYFEVLLLDKKKKV